MVNIPFASRFYHVHMHVVHSTKASCYSIVLQIHCLSTWDAYIHCTLCSNKSSSIGRNWSCCNFSGVTRMTLGLSFLRASGAGVENHPFMDPNTFNLQLLYNSFCASFWAEVDLFTYSVCLHTSRSPRYRWSFHYHGLQSVWIPFTTFWELNGVCVNSNAHTDFICIQMWPVRPSCLLEDISCILLPAVALWWQPGQQPAAGLHFFNPS